MGTNDQRFELLEKRVGVLETNLERHEADAAGKHEILLALVRQNMALTEQVAEDTKEIRTVWVQGKAAFATFNFLFIWAKRTVLFIVFAFLLFVGVPYMLTHGGELPPFMKVLKEAFL